MLAATCDVRHFLLLFAITLYHHKEAVGLSPEVLESSCARDLGTDLWELRQSLHLLNFSPSKLESQSLQFTKLFNPSLWLLDGIISSQRLPRIIPFLRFFVFIFRRVRWYWRKWKTKIWNLIIDRLKDDYSMNKHEKKV